MSKKPKPIAPAVLCNERLYVGKSHDEILQELLKKAERYQYAKGYIDELAKFISVAERHDNIDDYAPYFDGWDMRQECVDVDTARTLADQYNSMPREKHLIAAAVIDKGKTYTGYCHESAYNVIRRENPDYEIDYDTITEGFITSMGDFVNRCDDYLYPESLDRDNYIKKSCLNVKLAEEFAKKMGVVQPHLIACAVKHNDKISVDKDFAGFKLSDGKSLNDLELGTFKCGFVNSLGSYLNDDAKTHKYYENDFSENVPRDGTLRPAVLNVELAREFAERLNNEKPKKTEMRAMREFVNASSNYGKDIENPYWFDDKGK